MAFLISLPRLNISYFFLLFIYLFKFIYNQENLKICTFNDVGKIISECKNSQRKSIYI